ncbi:hypothetical protein FA15DRAFT_31787 [Coprinopsis marcescibilis]|uniref:Uncharacterized protein n=1 Tax=Coprinopsis marcescibilis TaxID=230819 RepID=A0A5C3LCI5_COPMA|nr:hypothetical protein FA15DRAFT_31787 [Coprinopsis marcescibilis]
MMATPTRACCYRRNFVLNWWATICWGLRRRIILLLVVVLRGGAYCRSLNRAVNRDPSNTLSRPTMASCLLYASRASNEVRALSFSFSKSPFLWGDLAVAIDGEGAGVLAFPPYDHLLDISGPPCDAAKFEPRNQPRASGCWLRYVSSSYGWYHITLGGETCVSTCLTVNSLKHRRSTRCPHRNCALTAGHTVLSNRVAKGPYRISRSWEFSVRLVSTF